MKIMFGKKQAGNNKGTASLPGPQEIPGFIKDYIVREFKIEPRTPDFLQAVIKPGNGLKNQSLIRIYDPDEAKAIRFDVKDYTFLDSVPELIFYDGCYTGKPPKCILEEKRKADFNINLPGEYQVRMEIEGLREEGSTVFFFQSSGVSNGGPLGRGAAVIELRIPQPGKRHRYTVYADDVVGMKLLNQRTRLWESNNPAEIARWVKANQTMRFS